MALNYDEISSVVEKYFYPTMVDNIFTSNILFNRARKKWYKTETGGQKALMPVAYAKTSAAGWYSNDETLTVNANEQWTSAEWDWKQAYAAITVSGADEVKCSGSKAVLNFVSAKVELAEMTLKDELGDALYNVGTTANEIQGLRLAVSDSGTYGGIARSSYSWWASQEDSSTTVLSLTVMQGIFGDCTVGNSHPTLIVTTQDIFDIYWAKLQPQQRYTDSSTASAGFQNLTFNGAVPVVVDGHCPSSHMFFLNEEYLKFLVQSERNFKFEPFIRYTNADAATAKILWMGALGGNNPRMQGKLDAITG